MNRFAAPMFYSTALLAILALSGCAPQVDDPTPSAQTASQHAARRVASTPIGTPFDLGPCKAQAHRIEFSGYINGVTAIMATCPGAAITTTSQGCGKNCIADQSTITPDAPVQAAPKLAAPAPSMTRDQAEAIQAQIRLLQAEIAQSQRKLEALSALAQPKSP